MNAAMRVTLLSKTGENNRNREAVSKETCFSSSKRYYQTDQDALLNNASWGGSRKGLILFLASFVVETIFSKILSWPL